MPGGQYERARQRTSPHPVSRILALLVAVSLGLLSCSGGDAYEGVSIPETPVVTLRPTWALIRAPYLRLYEQASETAAIAGHLRMGDIAEVAAIGTRLVRLDGTAQRWYLLSTEAVEGWTVGTGLELFTSRERARNAARNSADGP